MTATHSTMRHFGVPRQSTANTLSGAASAQTRGRKRLPDLEPAQPSNDTTSRVLFTSASIKEESTVFTEREECGNETAKLTVYVMNAILFVIAFPVGFGMLIFNILGGENLRTTAHAVALTGMSSALTFSGTVTPFFG